MVSLNLKWDEKTRSFDVGVDNPTDSKLEVLGIQSTPGIYVVDFPKSIPPRKSGTVSIVYASRPGLGGTRDIVRLLTNAGEREIILDHNREEVIRFDPASVEWKLNEKPAEKIVTLTVVDGKSTPKSVDALGAGNKAVLKDNGHGHYSVAITPGNTSEPQQFTVVVRLQPELPGVVPVISCSVTGKN